MGDKPLTAQERREKVPLGRVTSASLCVRMGTGRGLQIKFFQDFLNTKLIPDEKFLSDRCDALAQKHEKFKVREGDTCDECAAPRGASTTTTATSVEYYTMRYFVQMLAETVRTFQAQVAVQCGSSVNASYAESRLTGGDTSRRAGRPWLQCLRQSSHVRRGRSPVPIVLDFG